MPKRRKAIPGLVVHGPYTAALLVDHFPPRHPRAAIAKIAFRARRPLFEGAPIHLRGRTTRSGADLWAWARSGEIAMDLAVIAAFPPAGVSNS